MTAAAAGDAARARDLARMRALATGLLVAMLALFVAAAVWQRRWPWLAYVRAFAEAGAVGACADWFAVTALFRRPLGLPIPHTAVIPRNKDRIGRSLGAFIADNFLTHEVLSERLHRLEVARWGGDWLRRPQNAARLARRLAAALPGVLGALPPGALGELVGSAAVAAARAAPAGPAAARILGAVWSEGRARGLIERVLERLAGWLVDHEEAILARVSEESYRWMPKWLDRLLARKLTEGLIRTVKEMQSADHPWRRELQGWVEDFVHRLAHDPALQAEAEALKLRLLADPEVTGQFSELWAGLTRQGGAQAGLAGDGGVLAARLERALAALGGWLAEDEAAQGVLNTYSRRLALGVIAPRRHEIGHMVGEVVSSWDAGSVVRKLELQVGRDLQYIRINGALVGGLAGLAIFAVARWMGLA